MTALGFRLPPNSATDPEILACDLALRVAGRRHAQPRPREPGPRAAGRPAGPGAHRSAHWAGTRWAPSPCPRCPALTPEPSRRNWPASSTRSPRPDPARKSWPAPRPPPSRELLATVSSSQGRAFTLAYSAAAFGDPELINTAPDRIAAITPDQVRQAAARWLRPDCAAIVTTRPALPGSGPSYRGVTLMSASALPAAPRGGASRAVAVPRPPAAPPGQRRHGVPASPARPARGHRDLPPGHPGRCRAGGLRGHRRRHGRVLVRGHARDHRPPVRAGGRRRRHHLED